MAAAPSCLLRLFCMHVELTNIGWAAQMWQLALALFIFGVVGNMANISVNTQGVLAEKVYGRPIMTSFHGVWSIAGFHRSAGRLINDELKAYTPPAFLYCGSIGFYYCLHRKKIFDSRHYGIGRKKEVFFQTGRRVGAIGNYSLLQHGCRGNHV